MNDGLLFPVEESLSPRLAWIRRNHVVTYRSDVEPVCWFAGKADAPVTDVASWFVEETSANGDSRIGEGDTEDEAIAELARKHGMKLWNEGAGA